MTYFFLDCPHSRPFDWSSHSFPKLAGVPTGSGDAKESESAWLTLTSESSTVGNPGFGVQGPELDADCNSGPISKLAALLVTALPSRLPVACMLRSDPRWRPQPAAHLKQTSSPAGPLRALQFQLWTLLGGLPTLPRAGGCRVGCMQASRLQALPSPGSLHLCLAWGHCLFVDAQCQ